MKSTPAAKRSPQVHTVPFAGKRTVTFNIFGVKVQNVYNIPVKRRHMRRVVIHQRWPRDYKIKQADSYEWAQKYFPAHNDVHCVCGWAGNQEEAKTHIQTCGGVKRVKTALRRKQPLKQTQRPEEVTVTESMSTALDFETLKSEAIGIMNECESISESLKQRLARFGEVTIPSNYMSIKTAAAAMYDDVLDAVSKAQVAAESVDPVIKAIDAAADAFGVAA